MRKVTAKIAAGLRDRRTEAGGVRSRPGGHADAESTALAALAWDRAGEAGAAREARSWLMARQRPDGGFALFEGVEISSWATAWVALALAASGDSAPLARAGRWLVRREGRRRGVIARLRAALADPTQGVAHNVTLRGWPWHADAASWVEPTASSMLALHHLVQRVPVEGATARIEEGTRLLFDRACESGGWNYGNRRVLDVPLPAYPDTTALALLALQREGAADITVRALDALETMLERHDSCLALALGAIALACHGRQARDVRERLRMRLEEGAAPGRDTRSLAWALLALGDEPWVLVP